MWLFLIIIRKLIETEMSSPSSQTHGAALTPSRLGAQCSFEEGLVLWMNNNSPGFVLMKNWEDFYILKC